MPPMTCKRAQRAFERCRRPRLGQTRKPAKVGWAIPGRNRLSRAPIPMTTPEVRRLLSRLVWTESQGEMYISPDRTVGRPKLGRKGDMRRRGVLEIVFETPEMHIPPWYWFSSCGQRQPDIGEGQPPLGPVLQTEDRAYRTAFGLQDSIAPCTDRIASWPGHQEGLQPAGVK